MPPEANTGRMIAGAGAEPYLQAEMGWQALALDFTSALMLLRAEIAAVSTAWQGMASSQAQAAFEPYLAWMMALIAQAEQRAIAAAAQAATYSAAVAETPTLAEIADNHITHAVLEGTNFMGCNAVPIALNEFDYLVILWNRAAGAMDGYAAGSGANTVFIPFMPAPSVMAAPGAPEAGLAAILANTAAQLPMTVAREALLAEVTAMGAAGATKGRVQQVTQLAGTAANVARGGAQAGSTDATQMVQQMATQAPQMAAQVPQQVGQMLGQGPQQLMQAASQPMQQISSLFQQMSGGDLAKQGISPADLVSHFGSPDQLGAYGTSAVGSSGGGYGGAGLLSASHSGGSTALRSPAGWSQPAPAAAAVEQAVRTTASASGGSSAVGSGAGMGPMAGARGRGEGSVITLEEVLVEETPVVTTLGFEVFDG